MILSEVGESRVRGYLFVLERALRTFLPRDVSADAVREVESHIRERVRATEGMPNERDALERLLAEPGPPLQVARAYSDELTVDEAVASGRIAAVASGLLRVATRGLKAFAVGFALFVGYAFSLGFALIAVLKPVFPENTGLWVRDGIPRSFGTLFPAPQDAVLVGGYWVVPFSIIASLGILLLTHCAARAWLRRWRGQLGPLTEGAGSSASQR